MSVLFAFSISPVGVLIVLLVREYRQVRDAVAD
jgi:hypothetical protein